MDKIETRVKQVYPKRVVEISDYASSVVGKCACEEFSADTYNEIIERKIQSPIESMFYVAVKAINRVSYLCNVETDVGGHLGERVLSIAIQPCVGPYKADFILSVGIFNWDRETNVIDFVGKEIAVELDGHEFHDKNEKQRRYEKKRDRYFQKEGYTVFRFTGAEIYKNPFNAAVECMACLLGYEEKEVWESLPDAISGFPGSAFSSEVENNG